MDGGSGLIVRRMRRAPFLMRAALWLLLSHLTPWTSRAIAANTEKDVLTTATDLTAGASYSGGGTPGTAWDATFTTATYGATTFTVNTNLGLGTLNDLDAAQALIITNNGTSARTLTLSGGGDTVAGTASTDFIYLGANGSLTIQNGAKTLGLVLASDGNFDTGAATTLAISSIISGSFNLTKTGAGTLTLSGTNTFGAAGKTFTLTGGTLNINAAAALGNAANGFLINGGTTIDNTSGAAITTSNYAVTINGDFTFAGGGTATAHDLNLGAGAVTLGTSAGSTRTITTTAANSKLTFGGVIANGTTANAIIKTGAGTLTFSGTGANSYTGNTTVLAGTLLLSKSANVNAIAGGTLQIGSSTGGSGSATVLLAANGQIANAVNVSVLSSGIFSLNNFTDTIAALTLQSDTAQSASVTIGTGALTLGGNATLNTNGTGATGATFTGNLNLGNAARTFTVAQGSAMAAYDLLVSGVVSSTTAASGSIVKSGAGTLQFAGTAANTYTGLTTVNAGELDLNKSAGVLAVAGNLTIGDGAGGANSDIVKLLANGQIATTSAVLINGSSGTLNLNGFTQTISSLADTGTVMASGSSVNLGAGTLTVGDTTTTTFSGAINGTGGSLIKQGTGTLALAGTNTYTGTTTITAGTLQLNSSVAFPTSGNLTMLGGTFDIHGTSPTVGNITFGDGTVTAQTTLADSGTVKGAIILSGGIAYNGTSARTFPPGIINTAIQLAPGLHSISNPNGYYSTAASYDVVFNGVISGLGGISKDGPSNLFWVVFNAANTYTGPTNVTAGNLYLGVPNAIPSNSAVNVSSGASLILNAPTTEVGVTAGIYSQTIGSLSGAGTVSLGSATLTTGNDGTSTTFSGTITGTGGITKVGTGVQTLSGTSSYTGATFVSGGELIVSGSLAATAITVNSGATLYVPGTLAGSTVVVNAGGSVSGSGAFGSSSSATGGVVNVGGGAINLVDGAITTLTITGNSSGATAVTLTLGGAAGVMSALDLETSTGSTDKIAVLQKAQVNAGGAVINLSPLPGTVLGTGTYPLVTYASDTLTGAYSLGTTTGNGGFAYALVHTATAENLVVTAVTTPATAYWNGGQGAVWNAFAAASNTTNWSTTAAATANTNQLPGATTDVYFTVTSGAANLTNTLGADFSIHSLNFTAGSTSAIVGGTNNLTIGAGGINSVAGAAAQTIAMNVILGTSETWTVNGGAITVSGTSITGSGNNLTIAGSGNMAISAALQTGAGTLTKNGTGTLTLSGANTYTGATGITAGTLTLGASNSLPAATAVTIASGATLNLANFSQTVASITGAGTVAIGSGALTVGDSTSVTFAGSITGSGTLTKAGTGTWSLSGTSPFSGLVIVSGGTIHVLANGALGDPEVQAGAQIILAAGITVSAEPLILAGTGTTGAGALQVTSGASGWNGPIQLSADASIGVASGSTLTLSGPVALSGQTLTFLGAGTNSVAGAITGSGTLAQSGTGILILGGTSTFTGAVAVNAGTLQFGASGAFTGSPDVTVASGATLDVHDFTESVGSLAGAGSVVLGAASGGTLSAGASGASTAFSGTISGVGSIEKTGAGTLTLSSANTYTGGAKLTGGIVIAANNSAFSAGTVTFNGGGLASDNSARTLANTIVVNNVAGNQITGSSNITLTGAASGAGTLAVNMAGSTNTVTINPTAANSFAPAMLRLNSGTLLLGGANKIGDTTAITLNGGTLATGGYSDTMGPLAIAASSVLDFGTSNIVHLQFSSASWTGGMLTVENWTGTANVSGNPDQFLVSSGPVSSAFLSEITFQGYAPGAIAFGVGGGVYEIVPVPEPATIFGGAALLAFVGWRERRRVGRMLARGFSRS